MLPLYCLFIFLPLRKIYHLRITRISHEFLFQTLCFSSSESYTFFCTTLEATRTALRCRAKSLPSLLPFFSKRQILTQVAVGKNNFQNICCLYLFSCPSILQRLASSPKYTLIYLWAVPRHSSKFCLLLSISS